MYRIFDAFPEALVHGTSQVAPTGVSPLAERLAIAHRYDALLHLSSTGLIEKPLAYSDAI